MANGYKHKHNKFLKYKGFKKEVTARCWAKWAEECGKFSEVQVEEEYDGSWFVIYRNR